MPHSKHFARLSMCLFVALLLLTACGDEGAISITTASTAAPIATTAQPASQTVAPGVPFTRVIATATVAATATPVPPTPTKAVPTPTRTPTAVPTTAASTKVCTPAGDILLKDDLTKTRCTGWKTAGSPYDGLWAIEGNKYTMPSGKRGLTYIGDPDWKDYSLEVQVTGLQTITNDVVIVRMKDINNYLGLIVGRDVVKWVLVKDGKNRLGEIRAVSRGDNAYQNTGVFRIEVRGTDAKAYDKGKEIANLNTDEIPESGYIGFATAPSYDGVGGFSNVTVTNLK